MLTVTLILLIRENLEIEDPIPGSNIVGETEALRLHLALAGYPNL